MGQNRTLFLFFYTSFSLAFCLLGLVVYEVTAESHQLNEIECTGDECTQGEDDKDLETLELALEDEEPTEEEWISIINALSEDQPSAHIRRRGLAIYQTQTGDYDYSYGNKGTFRSKQLGKMNRKGRKTLSTGMYFQMAKGQVGETTYASGFVIFGKSFASMGKGGAKWGGKQKGFYFNKNPDGSVLIFGRSKACVHGIGTSESKTKFDLSSTTHGILNATKFVANGTLTVNTTMDVSDKQNAKAAGTIVFSARPAEEEDADDDDNMITENDAGFIVDATATFKSVYTKSNFTNEMTGTVSGSVINSTLVVSSKGKIWVKPKHHHHHHHHHEQLKNVFNFHFWFSMF